MIACVYFKIAVYNNFTITNYIVLKLLYIQTYRQKDSKQKWEKIITKAAMLNNDKIVISFCILQAVGKALK